MGYQIDQLGINDYEEMVDFLNLVFSMAHGPHDFAELLPAFYQPTHERMTSHWVVRQNGRIRSLIGIYPTNLHVGSHCLRVASVGAVSTHPRHRNRGMMTELMNHGLERMKAEGVQLSVLGGKRQRYAHFGYEICGTKLEFLLTADSIGNAFDDEAVAVLKEATEADRILLTRLKKMHDRQKLYCDRPFELFHAYGRNWMNRLYSVQASDEPCVGYLICNEQKDRVSEIVAERLAMNAICSCVRSAPKKRTYVSVGTHQIDLIRELAALCESVELRHTGNWNILDWASVTEAFLQFKSDLFSLLNGRATIGIDAIGSLELIVENQRIQCMLSDKSASCSFPAREAQRLLFGPIPPDFVAELPDTLKPLRSWCPLPLYIGDPDGA